MRFFWSSLNCGVARVGSMRSWIHSAGSRSLMYMYSEPMVRQYVSLQRLR